MNAWLVFITVASVSVAIVCAYGWFHTHRLLGYVFAAKTFAEVQHIRNAWFR